MSVGQSRSLPHGLNKAVKRIGRRFGVDIRRYRPDASMGVRRHKVILNSSIGLLLDVGANRGQYGSELRANGYGGKIISFEPLSEAFKQLRKVTEGDSSWHCVNLAIGAEPAVTEMNVSANLVSSSLLPMATAHLRIAPDSNYLRKESVQVVRLDEFLSSEARQIDPIMLKIDAQGYEMEVLRGSAGILSRVQVIEAELSVVELYEGQPLAMEVWSFLEENQFQLVGVEPGFSDLVTGRMLQMDGLFVRTINPLPRLD